MALKALADPSSYFFYDFLAPVLYQPRLCIVTQQPSGLGKLYENLGNAVF